MAFLETLRARLTRFDRKTKKRRRSIPKPPIFELSPLERRILLSASYRDHYDFESGVAGSNWSTSGIGMTAYTPVNSYLAGSSTLTLGSLPVHNGAVVSFDIYAFDQWWGDEFTLTANGATIVDTSFANDWNIDDGLSDGGVVGTGNEQNYPDHWGVNWKPAYSYATAVGDMDQDGMNLLRYDTCATWVPDDCGGGDCEGDCGCDPGGHWNYVYTPVYGNIDDSIYHFTIPIDDSSSTLALAFTSYANMGVDNVTVELAGKAGNVDSNGVDQFTGNPVLNTTSISSKGQGGDFQAGSIWSNGDLSNLDAGPGDSELLGASLPSLLENFDGSLVAVASGNNLNWFEASGGGWDELLGGVDSLTGDATTGFTLTHPDGSHSTFGGFSFGIGGKITSLIDSYGDSVSFSYNSAYQVTSAIRTDVTGTVHTKEAFSYTYIGTGDPNVGRLSGIGLGRKAWDTGLGQSEPGSYTTIRQMAYTYFGTGSYLGELELAQTEDASSNVLETQYYRYYSSGGWPQTSHQVEFVLDSESYARLASALSSGTTPLTASDSQVQPYAQEYYHLGTSGDFEATTQGWGASSAGGLGIFSYTFAYNSSAPSWLYEWNSKTTVTYADGGVHTHYFNTAGQQMLSVLYDGSHYWGTFVEFDGYGRPVLVASPSAVNIPSLSTIEAYPDLMHNVSGNYYYLNDSSGLITTSTYYSSTTATDTTPGGILNYVSDTYVLNGETGTPVHQEYTQYYKFTGTVTSYKIANDTVYGNVNGTDARTTSYSYTLYYSALQPEIITVTEPSVSTSQNGPNSSDTASVFYDRYGDPIWTLDEEGHVNYMAYDAATGAVVKTITDVVYASLTSAEQALFPSGWTHPSGGLHLVTTATVDALGRITKATTPRGIDTYFVYNDVNHEERVYPDFNGTTTTGPIEVIREYRPAANSGNFLYVESLTSSATPHLTGGVPDGTETLSSSNIGSLQRTFTNAAGQLVWTDQYFAVSGLTYSQAVGADGSGNPADLGTSGTNYYRTTSGYDVDGRISRIVLPTGTIYRLVYDDLDRVVSYWVGTNDTPASGTWSPSNNGGSSNMQDFEDKVYDGGGVGDGNLTQITEHPGLGLDDREIQYLYDFRDRLVAEKVGTQTTETDGAHRPIIYSVLDNLGEPTRTYVYDGDGVSLSDFATAANSDAIPTADAGKARALSVSSYDDQGRVYRSQVFDIDQSSGTSGLSDTAILAIANLATDTFYDHRGDTIAIFDPGGQVTKSVYDGAGRLTAQYVTDGGAVNNSATQQEDWTHATAVSSDVVLTQVEYSYDGDGNVVLTTTRDRFNTDSTSSTGTLDTPSSGVHARVSFQAVYYDAADRVTDTVDVGTNGGSGYTRPSSVPTNSTTVRVTHTAYDAAGNANEITDPRGIMTQYNFDPLGRRVAEIDDSDGASPALGSAETDYAYDAGGHVVTMTAVLIGGTNQTTAYVYGVGGTSGTNLFSNDLLAKIEYPNPSTGVASTSAANDVSYSYDWAGGILTMLDQNGTTHTYNFDVLGRHTSDSIAVASGNPQNIDTSVVKHATSLNALGLPYQETSYNSSSVVVNQIQYGYDGFGAETVEYQEHGGSVSTSTSAKIQYAYAEGSGNSNRMTSQTFTNGRVLGYVYSSGIDAAISRVSYIADDAGTSAGVHLEAYSYLGLDTLVERDHPETGVNQTLIGTGTGDGGDQYVGLDRFGQIVLQNWTNGTTSLDEYEYGYDANGNVLYQKNDLSSTNSELYHANSAASGDNSTAYDTLNRLTAFQRGTLSSSGNNGSSLDTVSTISTTFSNHDESWTLDSVGNPTSETVDSGSPVTRSTNSRNQMTGFGGNTLTFDNNGNTTTDAAGQTYKYDGWNNIIQVKDSGGTTLATYAYDAADRRVSIAAPSASTRDLYYDTQWRVIDEYSPGTLNSQNVFSAVGYIDTLVLSDHDATTGGSYGKSSSGLDQRLYEMQDGQDRVSGLVNTSGSVVERFEYDPYGTSIAMNSSWGSATTSYSWEFYWKGMLQGSDGIYYVRNRDYSPSLQRFLEADPAGYVNGPNLYQYVESSPVLKDDPLGTDDGNSQVHYLLGKLNAMLQSDSLECIKTLVSKGSTIGKWFYAQGFSVPLAVVTWDGEWLISFEFGGNLELQPYKDIAKNGWWCKVTLHAGVSADNKFEKVNWGGLKKIEWKDPHYGMIDGGYDNPHVDGKWSGKLYLRVKASGEVSVFGAHAEADVDIALDENGDPKLETSIQAAIDKARPQNLLRKPAAEVKVEGGAEVHRTFQVDGSKGLGLKKT